jgi:hypothetical protein
VKADIDGFTLDATETVKFLVDEPSAFDPEYVVSVAVAVALVELGRYAYHVVGMVNEVEELLAATFTVTDGALEYVKTSLYVYELSMIFQLAVPLEPIAVLDTDESVEFAAFQMA